MKIMFKILKKSFAISKTIIKCYISQYWACFCSHKLTKYLCRSHPLPSIWYLMSLIMKLLSNIKSTYNVIVISADKNQIVTIDTKCKHVKKPRICGRYTSFILAPPGGFCGPSCGMRACNHMYSQHTINQLRTPLLFGRSVVGLLPISVGLWPNSECLCW